MGKIENKADDSKKFWLFLHPYVYVAVKKSSAIIYNTLSGKLLEYSYESDVYTLIKRLNNNSNHYVVKIQENKISNQIRVFIDRLREFFLGDLIDATPNSKKPFQLKPTPSFQMAPDLTMIGPGTTNLLELEEIPDYLEVINLYIHNDCGQSCAMCSNAYKQFLCCYKETKHKKSLRVEDIVALVRQVKKSRLHKLNIVGGDLFHYSPLEELVKLLNKTPVLKVYYSHYLNIKADCSFFSKLKYSDNKFIVIVHFPVSPDVFCDKINLLRQNDAYDESVFHFIIQSQDDIEASKELVTKFRIKNSLLFPYFNGDNIDFFQKYVFLDRVSISNNCPDMHDIFMRQVLNFSEFKKLSILSDTSIYANLNNPRLGKLGQRHIFDFIHRELYKGKSWTKVRKNVMPCKSCVFNAMCPPISNYEYAIGRYDLCTILSS